MGVARYPEYKDSGVEWLGEIPKHWHIDRFKWSTLECRNGIWGSEAKGDEDDIACIRVADFDRVKLKVADEILTIRSVSSSEKAGRIVRSGDLLLEKSGGGENQPVGFVALYDGELDAVCSNFVARIRIPDGQSPSFWRYAHHAAYTVRLNYRSIKQTSGIQNLDQHLYLDELAPYPPHGEQQAIAAFLDHETSKIDALIAEQQRLIALLKEKRQAVISHAVTKGLNPNAPMKPSGIPWLGEVPEHWEILHVRRVISHIEQGWSPECYGRPAESDEWGILRTGCVNRGVFSEHENKALPETLEEVPEYEIKIGDVLMSRASGTPQLVGSTAYISKTRPKLMLSDKIFRIHPEKLLIDSEFFAYAFNGRSLREQIERTISGAEGLANNLPQSALRTFLICVPPITEQVDIARNLQNSLEQIDKLTVQSSLSIKILQERRTALISAAVTGKIDVRGTDVQATSHRQPDLTSSEG